MPRVTLYLCLLPFLNWLVLFNHFPFFGFCRDSDSEEVQNLEERRRLLIAGKLVSSTEEALDSTGAKKEVVVPTATTYSQKVVITEGTVAMAGGSAPQTTLVIEAPSSTVHPD